MLFSGYLARGAAPTFSWARTWGGWSNDAVHHVALDASGNVYAAGEFSGTVDFDPGTGTASRTSVGNADCFLSKFDSSGNYLWAKTWGGVGRDVPNGLAVDTSGNVYVSGPFQYTVDFDPDPAITQSHSSNEVTGANNIFLSKFDSTGKLIWVKTWGPSNAGGESYSITLDASNNIYVVGDFCGTTTNFNPWDPLHPDWHTNHPGTPLFFDSFLSKFDSDGNFQWARTWGGEGYDDGPGVAVDGSGNVYVAGMYGSTNIDFDPAGGGAVFPAHDSGALVDAFLSSFTSTGAFRWVKTWGAAGTDDCGEQVIVDSAGGVYVTGRYGSTNCDFDPSTVVDIHSTSGSLDAFVSKFDTSGNFLWAKTWGGEGWDACGSLALDAAHNLYVTGLYTGTCDFDPGAATDLRTSQNKDIFISAFDPSGAFLWAKTWGSTGDDMGFRACVNSAGTTLYVVGSFQNTVDFNTEAGTENHASNGSGDAFLSKFSLTQSGIENWMRFR